MTLTQELKNLLSREFISKKVEKFPLLFPSEKHQFGQPAMHENTFTTVQLNELKA